MLAFDRRLDWIQLKYLMVPFTLKYSKDTALKQLTTWGGAQVHRRHQYGKKKVECGQVIERWLQESVCLGLNPGFIICLLHFTGPYFLHL